MPGSDRIRSYRVGMRPPTDAPKDAWRRWALDRRRARSPEVISTARAAITAHLLIRLADHHAVCCYLPLRTEPLDPALPAALVTAGIRVLVPLTRPNAPLEWTEYRISDRVLAGPFGVPEPADPQIAPAETVAGVDAVLVPALLVDARGARLGRGGGHYDRSFAGSALGRAPQRIAVIFDDEQVPRLPVEECDIPMTAVVTPTGGVQDFSPEHAADDLR